MTIGKRTMGMRKHGQSGNPGKSPKLRLAEKLQAENNERKPRQYPMSKSIEELFNK